MPFPYKTVLITGATSGIGRALAERMIANDIFVIAVGRRKDRLDELVAKHGAGKVAAEAFDVTDLDAVPSWVQMITSTYPGLSSVVLNAGVQRTVDFTNPSSVALPTISDELATNYLSPVHMLVAFLPHLISVGPAPASVVFVSSGLALIPIARCPNYCATKAAIHSLAWTLRSQLSAPSSPATHHMRVIEVVPPAVQTELHEQQPELAAQGQALIGMPLDEWTDDAWAGLDAGETDEVLTGVTRERFANVENERRQIFKGFEAMMRGMEAKMKAGQKAP